MLLPLLRNAAVVDVGKAGVVVLGRASHRPLKVLVDRLRFPAQVEAPALPLKHVPVVRFPEMVSPCEVEPVTVPSGLTVMVHVPIIVPPEFLKAAVVVLALLAAAVLLVTAVLSVAMSKVPE